MKKILIYFKKGIKLLIIVAIYIIDKEKQKKKQTMF